MMQDHPLSYVGRNIYTAPTSHDFNSLIKTQSESITNIPQYLLDLLSDISYANDLEIILRPVNPDALWHMKNGAVAKGMPIHGKSAIAGPVRGLIPCNASISKAGNTGDVDIIRKFQEENDHSFDKSEQDLKSLQIKLQHAVSNILAKDPERYVQNITEAEIIQEAQISRDSFDTIVSKVTLLTKNGEKIFIFENANIAAKDSGGPIYAIKVGDKYQKIDLDHNPIGEQFAASSLGEPIPVEVFGKPVIKITHRGAIDFENIRPITADVDVLAYGAKADLAPRGAMNIEEMKALDSERILAKKINIFRNSGFQFTDETIKKLAMQDIKHTISVIQLMKVNAEKKDALIQNLSSIDKHRLKDHHLEHLRSYGDTSAPIRAIVGALRADLDKYEISHGSEQLNYNFTQALDQEWIRVNRNGDVSVIKGESELLTVFTNSRKDGYSMPPNPNWGWKFSESGEYQVDDKLKEQNKFVDRLMFVETIDEKQQADIIKILDKRLVLGKLSIDSANNQDIPKLKAGLDEQIRNYTKTYITQPEVSKERASWLVRRDRSIEMHEHRIAATRESSLIANMPSSSYGNDGMRGSAGSLSSVDMVANMRKSLMNNAGIAQSAVRTIVQNQKISVNTR